MEKTDNRNLEYLKAGPPADEIKFTGEEMAILDHVNMKVAAGESLKQIIDFLFSETQSIMPCDRIGVAFLEEEGRRLSLYYVTASYGPLSLDSGYSSDLQGSSLAPIFSGGTPPRIINDLEVYYTSHPGSESTRLLLKEGVRSSMTCHLSVEGRPVGLLFRSSRKPGAYSAREVRLHQAVAERLSQAVEKAYRIEQLSAAFNSYMEMLGFVTHELKSPLSSIIMLAQTLTGGYFGEMSEKHREMIERIIKKAEYLANLSNEYLNLSRFESGKVDLAVKETDFIADVMEPAIEIIAPQVEANRVALERNFPARLPRVMCDAELLRIVMVNLMSNAVKYGNVHGRIRLTVQESENILRVSVWNEGPGFPESEKKFLFKKFSRLHTGELMGRKGSGVGLYMSWKTVQLHGGKIRAESGPGKWAEFIMELPLPARQ